MPTSLEGIGMTHFSLCLLGGDLQDHRKAGHGENFSFSDLDRIMVFRTAPDFFLLYNGTTPAKGQ